MWVSRSQWEELVNRVRELERKSGLSYDYDEAGDMYLRPSPWFASPEDVFSLDRVVAKLANKAGLVMEPERGAILKFKDK